MSRAWAMDRFGQTTLKMTEKVGIADLFSRCTWFEYLQRYRPSW